MIIEIAEKGTYLGYPYIIHERWTTNDKNPEYHYFTAYAGVDENSPLYGLDDCAYVCYSSESTFSRGIDDINVIGGITYTGFLREEAGNEYGNLWWFGFDTDHVGYEKFNEEATVDDIRPEVKSLIKQLKNIEELNLKKEGKYEK